MDTMPGVKQALSPAGFFVLRTPLLPYDELTRLGKDLGAPAIGGTLLDEALPRDRLRLRRRLADLLERPEIREAVFLASPDLEASIPLWRRDPNSERGQGIERALARYLVRAASRATPFGLFAGVSVGTTGQHTRLVLEPRDRYRRRTRVDASYLAALALGVSTAGDTGADVPFAPNPSLHRSPGGVRGVQAGERAPAGFRGAPDTPRLRSALARAEGGATTAQLVEAVAGGVDRHGGAARYVDELVRSQVLVPSARVPVTGGEPIEGLADLLEAAPSSAAVAKTLRAAADELSDVDAAGLGAAPERYRVLGRELDALPAAGAAEARFHVDLVKPATDITLGSRVLDEIARGVALLQGISRRRTPGDIDRFRDAFEQRYGGREVPLLEAVDDETGIGFGPPALTAAPLDGLSFPPPPPPAAPKLPGDDVLLGLLLATTARRSTEMVLEADDLEALADDAPPLPLPGAFAVLASLEADSDSALDSGDFSVLLRAVGGPSGAWLLGRFCHTDPGLLGHVEQHLRAEEAQDPDAVWAEIVHQPEAPFDNVVARPVLRGYEIACLGTSGASPDRQIALGDLLVSVVDGEVVLRSRRLGRRVVPRSTTAHDFTRSGPAVYRLLASLQTQGVRAGLSWTWGALEHAPFLPRVRSGRLVLSLARWQVTADELGWLGAASGPQLARRIRAWRLDREIPRLVTLVDGDAALLVDLENVLSAESFVHLVRGRSHAVLEEVFPSPDRLCARGPEGRFTSEIVVPFTSALPNRRPRPAPLAPSPVRRSFPPGSEWVSAKVYAGPSAVDVLLRDVVDPLRRRLFDHGHADGWFFVRYGDPHWHLRVRFHAAAGTDPLHVANEVTRALGTAVDDGAAWGLQLDTYDREVERYGGADGILVAERIFSADSDAVLGALCAGAGSDGGDDANDRWELAVRGVDALLDDLCLDDEQKLAVYARGRAIYAWEHRVDGPFEEQLSRTFRARRHRLDEVLRADVDRPGATGARFEGLWQRSRRLAPIGLELTDLERAGRLSAAVEQLATSYVHLHLNRLLTTAHRAQELLVYDTLLRLHRSRVARRQPPA